MFDLHSRARLRISFSFDRIWWNIMTFILMSKSNPRFVSLIKHYLFFVPIYHPCDRSLLRCHILSTHSFFNKIMCQVKIILFFVSIHIHFLSLHDSKFSFMFLHSPWEIFHSYSEFPPTHSCFDYFIHVQEVSPIYSIIIIRLHGK